MLFSRPTSERNSQKDAAGVITASAFISMCAFSLAFSIISVIINEVVREFSLSGTSEGLMSSLVSVGTMLSLLIAPFLQGRVGKMTMLVVASLMQAAALWACGAAGSFLLFCLPCVVVGMGGSFADSYCNSSVVDVRGADNRRYMGYLHGLFGVGCLLTPLLVFGLLRSMHWRGVYYIFAVILFAAGLAVVFLNRGLTGSPAAAAIVEKKVTRADVAAYLGKRRNLLLILLGVFATASHQGLQVWIVRYMTLRFDAAGLGAFCITLYWIFATAGRFFSSYINITPLKLVTLGAALSGLCVTAGVLSGSPVAMCVAMGAAGLASGPFNPIIFAEVAKGYAGQTTTIMSVFMSILFGTRSLVPLAMAFVTASVSPAAGMMLPALAALILCFLCAGLLRSDGRRANAGQTAVASVDIS